LCRAHVRTRFCSDADFFPASRQGSFSAEDFLQRGDVLTGMAIIAAVRHKKAIEPNHGHPYG